MGSAENRCEYNFSHEGWKTKRCSLEGMRARIHTSAAQSSLEMLIQKQYSRITWFE